MSSGVAILIALAVLIVFLVIKAPIWVSLALAGSLGLFLIDGFQLSLSSLTQVPFQSMMKATLVIIPLFILMGMLVKESGLVARGFAAIQGGRRQLPGSLAATTIASSAMFGAVAGTSSAVVGAVGRLSITEMVKNGYDKAFASGTVAASGTLGILIPPSIILVVYGQITEESIGALLLAGILPGILSAVAMIVYVVTRASIQPSLVGGRKPRTMEPVGERPPLGNRLLGLWGLVWRVGAIFGVVIGGIYTGFFTPTESAAVSVVVALLILIWDRRKEGARVVGGAIKQSLLDAGAMSGTILALLLGSAIFSVFVIRSGMPRYLTQAISGMDVSPTVVVILILIAMIPLGMFLDGLGMILITMPILHPVLQSLGIDAIWFAILMVKMCELGLITPPVGLNLFVTARSVSNLKTETVLKGVWPFYFVEVFIIVVLMMFPSIVTWLPSAAM